MFVIVQELSGHLAAEITRLCSLAKQDELPLTQGMDVYEMEVSVVGGASNIYTLDMFSLKTDLDLDVLVLCCTTVGTVAPSCVHCQ